MSITLRCTGLIVCLLGLGIFSGCAQVPVQNTSAITPSPSPQPGAPTGVPQPASPTVVAVRNWIVIAGGDVTPACLLDPYLQMYGAEYPYSAIAPIFHQADVGVVNLECPLSLRGRAVRGKTFTFRGQPASATALRRAGINAVSLANNHILDYGPQALLDTLTALDAADVQHAGAGRTLSESRRPALLTLPDGGVAALLSYSLTYPDSFWAGPNRPGTASADAVTVESDVRSACAWARAVIVTFHWGGELLREPKPYQVDLGHCAIDAGARLVLGTHPHVLQGVEWYRQGLICYSLGNLAFGGGQSRKAVHSALLKITFTPAGSLTGAELLPLSVDNRNTRFVPTPLQGEPAEVVIAEILSASSRWGTRVTLQPSGWAALLPPAPVAGP